MRIKRPIALAAAVCLLLVCGCEKKKEAADLGAAEKIELKYAEQFGVERCEDGCFVATVGEDKFLIVPEEVDVPDDTTGYTVIKRPVKNLYVAASSAMDLFDGIGKLGDVDMTSTDADSWSLPNIRAAVESGDIEYIGKYGSPDYEALVAEGCGLAIESTMIYHAPKVKEKIEALGVPVMVERSSYESHPLGRMEWMKLYGLVTGDYEAAEKLFDEKTKAFEEISAIDIPEAERKTAAFFYITSNGYFSVRKPGDYVSKAIELAGGKYVFTAEDLNVDDNALSTMNVQAETFYDIARDADVLIYNSTIDGEVGSVDDIIRKNGALADFKAVKNGDVWLTEKNAFQQTTGAADMICDLNRVFTGEVEGGELVFLRKLY